MHGCMQFDAFSLHFIGNFVKISYEIKHFVQTMRSYARGTKAAFCKILNVRVRDNALLFCQSIRLKFIIAAPVRLLGSDFDRFLQHFTQKVKTFHIRIKIIVISGSFPPHFQNAGIF